MKQILSSTAFGFHPGSFSFVMATGIVSLAVFQHGMETIAYVLFGVNTIAYAALVAVMVIRGVLFPGELLTDMTTLSRAPAFFTITAGTCILGSQFIRFSVSVHTAAAFWLAGMFFWAVLSYVFFVAVIVRSNKTAGEAELSGEWLLYAVGTQSLAILTILLAPGLAPWQDDLALAAASFHLAGTALYFILIVMIVRRMLFLDLPPEKLIPPYWINMGAAAISTLAGADLILHAGPGSMLENVLPALRWSTLLCWAVTTWWIPLIVILNVWRYIYKRFPIAYDVQHWSMVFPLGMYAACSFQLGNAIELTALIRISQYFVYLALAAWIVTFLSMVTSKRARLPSSGVRKDS